MESILKVLPTTVEHTSLRRFKLSGLARFMDYRSDPRLALYQGWEAMNVEEATEFVQRMSAMTQFSYGDWLQLAVVCAISDEFLGDVGLFVEKDYSQTEIGFTLSQKNQHQGHATRAVRGHYPSFGNQAP